MLPPAVTVALQKTLVASLRDQECATSKLALRVTIKALALHCLDAGELTEFPQFTPTASV